MARTLSEFEWFSGGEQARLAGLGGTIRNLAAAAQKRLEVTDLDVQGFVLTREALGELIEELASRPADKRGSVRGIKPDRGDVILGGAVVLDAAMEQGGFTGIEVTEAGLREGVLFERMLEGHEPPLLDDVRRASVENLEHRYHGDHAHDEHVAKLSLEMFDALGARGPARPGPLRARGAVGGLPAARHRRVDRLRRPPPPLALPDPEQRPAGLVAARAGADRAGGALAPQGRARTPPGWGRWSARATASA